MDAENELKLVREQMLRPKLKTWMALSVAILLLCAGCLRSGTRADLARENTDETSLDSHNEMAATDSLYTHDDSLARADTSVEETVEDFEAEIVRLFMEAEQYYALGVEANQVAEWEEAQYNFEKATEILATIDLANVETPELSEQFEILLGEIASDYQYTLASMGGLSSESSMAAFLLRFESLENLRDYQDTMAEAPEPEEAEEITYDVPIVLNEKVKNCIVYFQTIARKPMEQYLRRSGRYIPMMAEIIDQHGLPADLVYLPLIESGYNPKAYSYAHASGMWQFISSTGRMYGLDRSWWQDERRDFVKSTHAACAYLKKLYGMFDSWELALAAYNGGEGRVGRQIRRQRTDDFWQLRLRKQTRNYVPLYMAAVMIAKEPERFGFTDIEYDPPLVFDVVVTEKPIELKAVAGELNIPYEELKALNPELLRGVTPPGTDKYSLRVPAGLGPKFASVYPDLPESSRAQWTRHRVRRGETISSIASRYGVSQRAVVDANKLRSRHRIYIGQVLTIPVPSSAGDYAYSGGRNRTVNEDGKYFVKRGETLWHLSRDFRVSINDLRKANGMRPSDPLIAGRWIKIPGREQPTGAGRWYTIKRGDTISEIAQEFGVKVRDLMAANNLRNPKRIYPGTRLRIP